MHPSMFNENMTLVAEALRERTIMLEQADYMNKLLPLYIPNENYFW
jgi:glycerol-3-phosphate dehydrogenase